MYFEQFYLGCLAHASYLLGCSGEAIVIDPQRDVEIYLKAAAEQGLQIRHVFETHLHADFVSGHRELAERTGAQIYLGAGSGATFPHVEVADGFELRVGHLVVQGLSTPGHTTESICLVVTDQEKSEHPWAVFTGDTLFIGDVGRPDLSPQLTPEQLAGLLYDSLHNKLMKLPDAVLVYPAHGAGSLCGRNMRADRFSSIGTERLTNYALQIAGREGFVRQLTSNLPSRPGYFLEDAKINRDGAPPLSELPPLAAKSPGELQKAIVEGGIALDVRAADQFAADHVPGSVNISLSGQFASWAGTLLGLTSNPLLIAETGEQLREARLRLARVGIEKIAGYLAGGIAAWRAAGLHTASVRQISVQELAESKVPMQLLDVRREGEWMAGHVENATWWPLDNFNVAAPEIDRERCTAVHCKSGYRSMIACSLLQRAGFQNVVNVVGGFDAWTHAGLATVKAQAMGA